VTDQRARIMRITVESLNALVAFAAVNPAFRRTSFDAVAHGVTVPW
jgi:hypothetical protein